MLLYFIYKELDESRSLTEAIYPYVFIQSMVENRMILALG